MVSLVVSGMTIAVVIEKLPLYIQRSIEGHLQLGKSALKHLIEIRLKQ